jgi:dipeptidyl aminopeptidase/acylaminoacyl peptidase
MLNLENGTGRALVTRSGMDAAPRFSGDGKWIAFVSTAGHDDWHGNSYLHIVHPDGTGLKNISESFDEEIGAFGGRTHRWSPDGQSIYYLASQGVAERLFRIDVATGKYEAVTRKDEKGVCHSYSMTRDGRTAAVVLSDPHTPAEVYRLDLARGGQEKLTRINADFVGTAPSTELLRYRSPDGFELEGLVMKPKNHDPGKRYPLLVIIHGGPAGVFQSNFAPRRGAYPLHAFTDQGYVLFLPNPRGSGGYGERFRQANVRDWGYGDYRDIMQGVDLLIERGLADPERMGVMGWSYGGYMTSWIVSQTTRFKAASMGAGLSNLISMYGTTDIPEFNEAYFGGSKPWEDPQGWLKHSAINFVGQAKTPTLIQHGQEDRRVPLSQGEEFYLALKKVGVPVEMVVYPRQPHGIQEPRLIKDALERNLHWFNKWLLGIEPPKEGKTETKKTDD